MAQKAANIYARIEPDVKERAETILTFEVSLPPARQLDLSRMSTAELSEELEKGYADMKAGRTKSAKAVFEEIRKDYAL